MSSLIPIEASSALSPSMKSNTNHHEIMFPTNKNSIEKPQSYHHPRLLSSSSISSFSDLNNNSNNVGDFMSSYHEKWRIPMSERLSHAPNNKNRNHVDLKYYQSMKGRNLFHYSTTTTPTVNFDNSQQQPTPQKQQQQQYNGEVSLLNPQYFSNMSLNDVRQFKNQKMQTHQHQQQQQQPFEQTYPIGAAQFIHDNKRFDHPSYGPHAQQRDIMKPFMLPNPELVDRTRRQTAKSLSLQKKMNQKILNYCPQFGCGFSYKIPPPL